MLCIVPRCIKAFQLLLVNVYPTLKSLEAATM